MTVANSTTIRSTTLTAIKAAEADSDRTDDNGESKDSQSPTVIAAGTQRIDAQTTITTMVLTNSDSSLPNLSLEDVLEQSGVKDTSEILLEDFTSASQNTASTNTMITRDNADELRTAVDSIENAEAVVIEVETTNNVQTVKVRAADISAAYTQATADPATIGLSNFLLLKNGWAYTAFETSPLDLPLEPPDQQPGNGWAPWRETETGVHEIQDVNSGFWNRLVGLLIDTSPKPPSELAGILNYSTTDNQLLSTVTTSDTLELSSDGIFTNTRSVLASNGILSQEVGFISHTVHSGKNTSANISSEAELERNERSISNFLSDANEVLMQAANDMFGAYRMLEDGMTLELRYANGTSEHKLFLQTVDGNVSVDDRAFNRTALTSQDLLTDLMTLLVSNNDLDNRGDWLKPLADAARKEAEEKSSKTSIAGLAHESKGS